MHCPTCGRSGGRVLDTRRTALGTIRRTRQCAVGHKWVTQEVLEASFKRASLSREQQRQHAVIQRRVALRVRDTDVAKNLHKGWEPLAAKYKLSKSAVYRAAARGRKLALEQRLQFYKTGKD